MNIMRANFEIWGEDSAVEEESSPSPEPKMENMAIKSLMAAAGGLLINSGPMGMRVLPELEKEFDPESPQDADDMLVKKGRHSENQSKQDVLHTISRTINKTHASLKRSRLIHVFYILSLPLYTVLGAVVFMYLDGDYDEMAIANYDNRCNLTENYLANLQDVCGDKTVNSCLKEIEEALNGLDICFRSGDYKPIPTLSMKSFVNSVLFATSVYTTIGYGNMAAETRGCRIATIIYAIIGIPLFFAFLKDMGQLFSVFFIKGWRAAGHLKARLRRRFGRFRSRHNSTSLSLQTPNQQKFAFLTVPRISGVDLNRVSRDSGPITRVTEQRRVFLWAVVFFLIYLICVSGLFCLLEKRWNFFDSFYFLFTSVSLVGFGDVFPKDPNNVLINFLFIVLGIVLFGMCYFILQEEIREKAFQASRRVRNSIYKHQQRYKKRLSSVCATTMNGKTESPNSTSPNTKKIKDRRRSLPNTKGNSNSAASGIHTVV